MKNPHFNSTATHEETERAERLKRIQRCEEELQILRNLPADKVSEWIASRRTHTSTNPTNLTNPTNNPEKLDPPFVPHSTGPIASERVRIRERAAKVEALIAQGRFRQNSEFPTTVQVDNKPMKLREPGAIRLTDLQQRMVAKSQKRQEDQESKDEQNRQDLLSATESLSPRHRAKMRRSMGQKKSKAQQRYQRLLQARHRASELLQDRQARQSYGIDARALQERQLLLKQVRALREKLLDPPSLETARKMCASKSEQEIDEQVFPIPEGAQLERTRVSHLQSLAVLRADKEWWRAVRQGEEKDIRTCMDKQPCWAGWKDPDRLLNGKSLYGRASAPVENGVGGGNMRRRTPTKLGSPRKDWFIEPALGQESRALSDWWLNYALGALAESSEAERAIAEASEVGTQGKTFSEVLDRQTSKIVDYYKQQMNMEQEAYLKRTKLEKAEREWEEQDLLERDTFMEQSLAATMIALEADFEMPASPRRYDEEEDMEYGMEYGEDEDYVEDYGDGIDLSPRRHHGEEDRNDKRRGQSVNGGGRSRGYVKATRHRNGKGNGGANQRFASSLPPRGSAMRNTGGRGGGGGGGRGRGGGGLGAGRKTTHFEEDFLGEERKTQQRMNRTYSGSRRRGGSGGATYDNDMLERKTVVLGEERVSPNRSSPNRGSNNGSRRLQKGSQPARGNRRTSFMAVETIKETYDAIIESPTKGIDTMSPAATTNNINNINTMENVESRVTRLHKTLPAVLEEGGGGENEGVEGTEETTGTGGTNGATTGVAVAKKGHRRSATVGVEATPTRVEKTTASNDKLSPTSETRQARAMLTTLFQNMDKACQRKEVTLEEYINTEFVKCKKITSGNAPRAKEALTYEQFMTFLINMETYVEQELNIYVGIMDMPAKRIDVAFSIFDVDGDLSIGLSSVVRFMKSSCRNKGGSPNGDGGSGTMTKEDDGEEEEQSQFRLAIRQMQKGANWVARKEKSTVQRVVTDAFIERDADGTGAVTTGQFAQIIHQLGIEMTRSMTEALLKDLGVQANSLPNQRCVNYKKLIETM